MYQAMVVEGLDRHYDVPDIVPDYEELQNEGEEENAPTVHGDPTAGGDTGDSYRNHLPDLAGAGSEYHTAEVGIEDDEEGPGPF